MTRCALMFVDLSAVLDPIKLESIATECGLTVHIFNKDGKLYMDVMTPGHLEHDFAYSIKRSNFLGLLTNAYPTMSLNDSYHESDNDMNHWLYELYDLIELLKNDQT